MGADRFDDAIFAAFRRLEHEVQQRTGSPAIGTELVTTAFRDKRTVSGSPIESRTRAGLSNCSPGRSDCSKVTARTRTGRCYRAAERLSPKRLREHLIQVVGVLGCFCDGRRS
ncbi:TIGR02391 family protein [Streptomyces mirabilis]|uniref:TIGR02391 family protein n=1 Tax=Streptomyces mirabilis TaxID=68239 RepID=UPI0036C489A0